MSEIAIVGAGTMGRRLAFEFARSGRSVAIYDSTQAVVHDAIRWLGETMREWEDAGRLVAGATAQAMARIAQAPTLAAAVSSAAFIFENIPERLALKRALLIALAPLLSADAVIVSNTSSLPGSLMADASSRADRFINANFSHLGHQKVEVMPHPGTSEETRERVVSLLRATGFIPIVLRQEQFGYAGNRVWRAVKKEVLRQIAAGVLAPEELDRGWMLDWDVPMGPCALMDAIGLDVVRDIEQSYANASNDPSDLPPAFLDGMVKDGHLGVKTGQGFYDYPDPSYARPDFLNRS